MFKFIKFWVYNKIFLIKVDFILYNTVEKLKIKEKEEQIMGSGSYSVKDWSDFSTSRRYHDPKTSTDHIYNKRTIDDDLNPKNFKVRESVDGPDNPESTPIIIGLDVTGSMSPVLDRMARHGMKTVCEEIYNRKPVTNPHICTLGIGDVECDRFPFQATQFEADIRIFKQLEKLYLEKGGGGNNFESYILAWYFAKYRTKIDSFTKRGKKGFIFTIGDEEVTKQISKNQFEKFLFDHQMRDMTAQELFDIVFPEWNVFHVIVKEGHHASYNFKNVRNSWESIIGAQRTIILNDHEKIGEVIVSAIEITAGKTLDHIKSSWDGSTAVIVGDALQQIDAGSDYQPRLIESVL